MLTFGILSSLFVATYGIPTFRYVQTNKHNPRPEALQYAERNRNAAFLAKE